MNNTKDLQNRLREQDFNREDPYDRVCNEAADALEAQERRIGEITLARDYNAETVNALKAELAALREQKPLKEDYCMGHGVYFDARYGCQFCRASLQRTDSAAPGAKP